MTALLKNLYILWTNESGEYWDSYLSDVLEHKNKMFLNIVLVPALFKSCLVAQNELRMFKF